MKAEIFGGHVPASGAGVIEQRLLDEFAERNWTVSERFAPGSSKRSRLFAARRSDQDLTIYLHTPYPLRPNSGRRVGVVYDLRYLRSRGAFDSAYRLLDLRNTLRSVDHLFTISEPIKHQLEALAEASRVHLLPLGPGQFDGVNFGDLARKRRSVLLIGSAPHKRNDLAVECVLDAASSGVPLEVSALGLPHPLTARLKQSLPESSVKVLDGLTSQELRRVMQTHEYFLHCGVSEGLGFPYLEASSSGCIPIVRDYSVSRSILGNSGAYLADTDMKKSFTGILDMDADVLRNRLASNAEQYAWGRMVDAIEAVFQEERPG